MQLNVKRNIKLCYCSTTPTEVSPSWSCDSVANSIGATIPLPPPATPLDEEEEEEATQVLIILGWVLGGVVLLGLLMLIFVKCCRGVTGAAASNRARTSNTQTRNARSSQPRRTASQTPRNRSGQARAGARYQRTQPNTVSTTGTLVVPSAPPSSFSATPSAPPEPYSPRLQELPRCYMTAAQAKAKHGECIICRDEPMPGVQWVEFSCDHGMCNGRDKCFEKFCSSDRTHQCPLCQQTLAVDRVLEVGVSLSTRLTGFRTKKASSQALLKSPLRNEQ